MKRQEEIEDEKESWQKRDKNFLDGDERNLN